MRRGSMVVIVAFFAASVPAMAQTDFFGLCAYGSPGEVLQALKQGADANARYADGMTPLMAAASDSPNPETIAALLEAGADVNARETRYGATALMFAAADSRNPDMIAALLAAGADVNARDANGQTPLFYAAILSRNSDFITLLLNAGADPKARDKSGKTAFDYAQANAKLKGTDALTRLEKARP